MDLPLKKSKNETIQDISNAFREYEEYKKNKIDRYTKHRQLGEKGKEGTTFLVTDKNNKEYAMKTFRKTKSSNTLYTEYRLQKKASKVGISPKVYDYDTVSKYIIMERMDEHLIDVIKRQKKLYKYQQERIFDIFTKLDEIGVFHNDANIYNYMTKGKQIYIIDYGFAKEITPKLCKKLKTDRPNRKLMLISFIVKLKDYEMGPESYRYLINHISNEDIKLFNLNI